MVISILQNRRRNNDPATNHLSPSHSRLVNIVRFWKELILCNKLNIRTFKSFYFITGSRMTH